MNHLQELIDTADRLCATLQRTADNELKFYAEAQLVLDKHVNQMNKMSRDLQCIKENVCL